MFPDWTWQCQHLYWSLTGFLTFGSKTRCWLYHLESDGVIWAFPAMGVPLNHPFLDEMFPAKPSSYGGTPMTMKTHKPLLIIYKSYINHH